MQHKIPTARLLTNILLSNCTKPMRWFGKMYSLGRVSMFSNALALVHKIMITKIRQIQLKVQKFKELMVKLKSKYLDKPDVYADLHKLDLKIEEVEKLIENDKS